MFSKQEQPRDEPGLLRRETILKSLIQALTVCLRRAMPAMKTEATAAKA